MPRLDLTDREQWALRDLLATEPCPGSPLPTRHVLELLLVLIPADQAGAVYEDGTCTVVDGIFLGGMPGVARALPRWTRGPHYLGIMHWGAHHPVAEQDGRGRPRGRQDGLCIGFRNGTSGVVQILLDRWHLPFDDRDVAMLQMLAPLLARHSRERLAPQLPTSLTTQERRVLSHVAAGRSNAEIAEALVVAPSTVRKHLENVYRKLGVSNRVAAVARLQGRDAMADGYAVGHRTAQQVMQDL